jgi:hypothetical protein
VRPPAAGRDRLLRHLLRAGLAAAARQGYPMLTAVRDVPVPVPAVPELEPVHRYPVTVARFPGRCPDCTGPVEVGEMITRGSADDGKWQHARCAAAARERR